ncbi:dipeptide epimerase, partial [Francisella tularensis subsp. holarctica]|nr:dipeptide epimerase [Francisella tularensis subsp. holarctica]
MNKIIDIKISIVNIPLNGTFVTAVRSTNHIDAVVVELSL